MGKRITDYPHTISFRLTDEAWRGIQKEIASRELTAHEWCRKAALDRLNNNYGLSKAESQPVTLRHKVSHSVTIVTPARSSSNDSDL